MGSHDTARAAAFGVDRRRAFVLGRGLIADLVEGLAPGEADWSVANGPCPRCGARHGRVEVTGAPLVASVSYAPGLVVAAVAPRDQAGRLGIDVESDAADSTRTRDLQRLLGCSGQPVLRRWTRLEAILKADGRGLLVDPASVRVSRGVGRIAGEPARYQVADLQGPTGYLVSLAWCGAEASATGSGRAIP
jgi:4'-phosphopantetheinyl transferase